MVQQTILQMVGAPLPAAIASGGVWVHECPNGRDRGGRRGYIYGRKTEAAFKEAIAAQGLPPDFDLPGMTVAAKIKAVGNGVPLALGRAIAKAVLEATESRLPR